MDAPDGEPVTLEPWQILIEHEGRPLKSARGETDVVSMDGVSAPGRLVERWTPTAPGDYRFSCRLDTGNAIRETDEANNDLELTIAVSAATRAR
jgi:subtilase family serine protease